jgi:large subunit ribosomal protein L31
MKQKTHPSYQEVLFVDSSTGATYIIGTTLQPKEKEMFEGKSYPICRVPISSSSHPFFTKSNQFVDSEGRMDKFAKKYQRKVAEVKKAQDKQEEANKAKTKVTGRKKK